MTQGMDSGLFYWLISIAVFGVSCLWLCLDPLFYRISQCVDAIGPASPKHTDEYHAAYSVNPARGADKSGSNRAWLQDGELPPLIDHSRGRFTPPPRNRSGQLTPVELGDRSGSAPPTALAADARRASGNLSDFDMSRKSSGCDGVRRLGSSAARRSGGDLQPARDDERPFGWAARHSQAGPLAPGGVRAAAYRTTGAGQPKLRPANSPGSHVLGTAGQLSRSSSIHSQTRGGRTTPPTAAVQPPRPRSRTLPGGAQPPPPGSRGSKVSAPSPYSADV